jgi:hypothetical protein
VEAYCSWCEEEGLQLCDAAVAPGQGLPPRYHSVAGMPGAKGICTDERMSPLNERLDVGSAGAAAVVVQHW